MVSRQLYCFQCSEDVQFGVRSLHAGILKEPQALIRVEVLPINPCCCSLAYGGWGGN